MNNFADLAKEYYDGGLSCSEAVINAAHDSGICKFENINEVHKVASMFSSGMSSGCLCGALAGGQIVLGYIFGRNISEKTNLNRVVAKEFIKTFKEQRKFTCCNALSAPYKNNPAEHRQNCINIVEESSQIAKKLVAKYSKEEVKI